MATVASIKVVKSFTYRGAPRLWSNRYHFVTGAPPDSTHWTTFSDAVVTAEKAMLTDKNTIVETFGYAAGSDVPVFTKTYSTAGVLTSSGNTLAPGDCALLVRYSTSTRTSKNHPLYLFNYYHSVLIQNPATPDTASSTQITPAATYASAWITGFSDGTTTYKRSGPRGDLATGELVNTQVHHRDFP